MTAWTPRYLWADMLKPRLSFRDPREPDPAKAGTAWHDHTCWKCREGEKPCAEGRDKGYGCSFLRARND